MRKKGIQHFCLFFAFVFLSSSATVFAEGSKQLLPNTGDELALYCNSILYYNFARYDGTDEQRLYIHIADPETEQVFLGFSQPHTDGHNPLTTLTSGYFRIKDPSGTVVYAAELVDGTTANIANRTQAINGPNQIVGTGGYDAFVFDPSGLAAGDYYIEFNLDETAYNIANILFRYFDITVASTSGSPTAVDGRLFSKNWALFAPSIGNPGPAPYGFMDRACNASFHILTEEGFVSKVDFNGARFQPGAFNISFNSSGTANTGNIIEDRKSLESAQGNTPEFKLFLTDPDPIVYPSGSFGEYVTDSDYPAIMGCAASGYFIRVAATAPGITEILLDQDGADGVYTPGTADRLIAYEIKPGSGESTPYIRDIPWDGLDGLGAIVDVAVPVSTEITFSQGTYHLPVYDVEFNEMGFIASIVRPIPPAGYVLKFYYDDTNITENGANPAETEGCLPGGAPACHGWNDKFYGDVNTINTYWYAKQENFASNITVIEPDCGCAITGTNIIGMVYNDTDGNGLKGGSEDGSTLSNIDIVLYEDLNQDGLVDAGDSYVGTDVTDTNGDFSFALNVETTENNNISVGSDDAEEDPDENIDEVDSDLSMSLDNFVGLRFQNVVVPQGATITSAYIELYSASTNTISADFDISAEASDDAVDFSTAGVATRDEYTSIVDWDNAEPWNINTLYQTPDITTAIQEVVNRPGWASGNSMVISIVKDDSDVGAGERHAASFDAASTAPKLIVTFSDLPKYYVLESDQVDFPSGWSLTTDNVETSPFAISELSDCSNYFGISPPLPVELSSFRGKADGCDVIVEWTAAIEEGLSHYELEHSSNGDRFQKITIIDGSSKGLNASYSHTDLNPGRTNYYRLRMVDADGSVEYSEVVSVIAGCGEANALKVYPNPLGQGQTLQVSVFTDLNQSNLRITNLLGKIVKVINLSTQKGWNSLQVDLSDLESGSYFILDTEAEEPLPVKFIIGK